MVTTRLGECSRDARDAIRPLFKKMLTNHQAHQSFEEHLEKYVAHVKTRAEVRKEEKEAELIGAELRRAAAVRVTAVVGASTAALQQRTTLELTSKRSARSVGDDVTTHAGGLHGHWATTRCRGCLDQDIDVPAALSRVPTMPREMLTRGC